MLKMILYAICFFVVTVLIQYILSRFGKNQKTGIKIWTGTSAIVVICLLGIYSNNICYLAAVLGFAVADEIGKIVGWHK